MFGYADEQRDAVRNVLRRVALAENTTVSTAAGLEHVLADLSGRVGEAFSGVPVVSHYGFHSEPLAGASALIGAFGGRSDSLHCFGVDDPRGRPSLGPGAVAIWDNNGQVVSLVQKNVRVVSPQAIHLVAPAIYSSVPIVVGP